MDEAAQGALPAPRVERRRLGFSRVWIIPVLAALVGLGLLFQHIGREGPLVTITFKSAVGLEAGKTQVRYKDVAIGLVTAVRLSPDFHHVEIDARIQREASPLMTDGASFWIVRPRVTLSEVSGLGTLFSGNYIGFDPGKPDRVRRQFTGLEDARVVSSDTPGQRFVLHTLDSRGIDVGLPVYYRGLEVGQVESAELAPDEHGVEVRIFVRAPYDARVLPQTRFWNASGLDLSVNGNGVNVRTESLVALLVGGIAFDNRGESARATAAAAGAAFTLYSDRTAAMKQPDPNERRYVLYFNESLEGIEPGSPVRFLGLKAGEVVRVGIVYDRDAQRVRGRVEIAFSPELLLERLPTDQRQEGQRLDSDAGRRNAWMRRLVEHGMRAQLQTASLVTGQRHVAFEYFALAPPARLDWSRELPELPVVPGTLPLIEERVTTLLDKIDALPLAQIGTEARALLAETRSTVAGVQRLVGDVDGTSVPKFNAALDNARTALAAAERTLDGASQTLVGPDAPGQRELRSALQEITRAARSLRTLSDSIERHPESLVRGRIEASVP